MDKLWAKLRFRSGASMIFSLAVFGIASLLSLSMLSIGMTTVRNTADMRRNEQAYLSDVAAARFLQSALAGQSVTKWVWVRPPQDDTAHIAGQIEYTHSLSKTAPSSAEALILDALIRLLKNGSAEVVEITPPVEQIFPVRIVLGFDADGNLVAVLHAVEDETGESGLVNERTLYTMELHFRATATPRDIYAELSESGSDKAGLPETIMTPELSCTETTYIWTAESSE